MKRSIEAPNLPTPMEQQFYPPKRGIDFNKTLVAKLQVWTKEISNVVATHGQNRGETPTVASAATLAITAEIMHVTGNAAIQELMVPPNFGGAIELICDDAFTTVVVAPPAGNIASASAPAQNTILRLTLSPKTGLWYPVS